MSTNTRARVYVPDACASPEAAVSAREMVHRLWPNGDPASRGLLLHGAGYSIAEAARRTGASRQQIYRRREQLRAEP